MEKVYLVYRHFGRDDDDTVVRAFRCYEDANAYSLWRNKLFFKDNVNDCCYVVEIDVCP